MGEFGAVVAPLPSGNWIELTVESNGPAISLSRPPTLTTRPASRSCHAAARRARSSNLSRPRSIETLQLDDVARRHQAEKALQVDTLRLGAGAEETGHAEVALLVRFGGERLVARYRG